jgi:hypothetical protein
MIVQTAKVNESVRSLIKELPEDVGSTFPDGILYTYLENYPEHIVRAIEAIYYKTSLMLFMLDSEALHSLRTVLPLVRRHGDRFRSEFSKVTDLIRLKSLLLHIYIADNVVFEEMVDSCGDTLAHRITEGSLGFALTDYVVTVSRICERLPRQVLLAIQRKLETSDVGREMGQLIGSIAADQRDIGAKREAGATKWRITSPLSGQEVSGEMYDAVWKSIKQISPNFIAYLSSNRNVNVASEIVSTVIGKINAEKDYEKVALCLAGVCSRNLELAVWLCVSACDPTHKDINKVILSIAHVNPKARERFEWFIEAEKNNPGRQTTYDFEQQKMIFS